MLSLANLFLALRSKAGGILLAIGAGFMVLTASYLKGRQSGKASERTKAIESDLQGRKIRDEVDRDIGRTPASTAADRLWKDWRRG